MQKVQPLAGRYRFLQQLTSTPRTVWLAQDETSGHLTVAAQVPARLAKQLAPCIGIEHPHLARLLAIIDPALPAWLGDLMTRAEKFDVLPSDLKMLEDHIDRHTRAAANQ